MLNCDNIFPKVILEIGPFKVYFYGLIIALSALLNIFALSYFRKIFPSKFVLKNQNEIIDFVFYTLLGGLLGARIFYILFYNLNFFLQHPLEMIKVQNGGMSVHGGLLGGVVTIFLFSKIKQYNFWKMTDLIVPFLALGLALGRLANFVNGELIGRETDFMYGCDFGDGLNRWPVQIFDSGKNFFIFAFTLFLLLKKEFKPGIISGLFLILIGLFRFSLEFIRQPDPQIGFIYGFLTLGQIFAILTFILGLIIIVYKSLRK